MATAVCVQAGQDVPDGRRRCLERGLWRRQQEAAARRSPCHQDGAKHLGGQVGSVRRLELRREPQRAQGTRPKSTGRITQLTSMVESSLVLDL